MKRSLYVLAMVVLLVGCQEKEKAPQIAFQVPIADLPSLVVTNAYSYDREQGELFYCFRTFSELKVVGDYVYIPFDALTVIGNRANESYKFIVGSYRTVILYDKAIPLSKLERFPLMTLAKEETQ